MSLRIDSLPSRPKLLAFTLLGVMGLYFLVLFILKEKPIDITMASDPDCKAGIVTKDKFCSKWDFSGSPGFKTSWSLDLKKLTKYHRFVLVETTPFLRIPHTEKELTGKNYTLSIQRTFTSSAPMPSELRHATLNQKVDCVFGSDKCQSFVLFYIPQLNLEQGDLSLTFTLNSQDQFLQNTPFVGLSFTVRTGNPAYISGLTTVKYLLFFVSLISSLLYYSKLRQIPAHMRVVEQTLLLRQSVLLVLMNDPFYGMIFYSPNNLHIIYTTLATTAFYSHLLYYWLVVFERIYVENSQKSNYTTQLWKKSFMITFFILGCLEFGMNTTMYSFDPGFQIDESYLPVHTVVKYFHRFLLGILACLILIFSSRVYIFWPTLIDRHKNNYLVSAVFFLITLYSLYKDNPLSSQEGRSFLLLSSLSTLYLCLLHRLFSLSNSQASDLKQAKYLPQVQGTSVRDRQYDSLPAPQVDAEHDDFDDTLKPDV